MIIFTEQAEGMSIINIKEFYDLIQTQDSVTIEDPQGNKFSDYRIVHSTWFTIIVTAATSAA